MNAIFNKTALVAAGFILIAFGPLGCGRSSGSSVDADSSETLSPADREAREAAMAELQRHWVKSAAGWITSVTTGTAYAPDHFLRQYRELMIESLNSQDLSQSDRLNGFEWVGSATFKRTVCREAGGQPTFVLDGMAEGQQAYAEKQAGRWSQWVDFTPGPLRFEKQKGRWRFEWDGSYLRGQPPSAGDYASARVR
jgi:hypothetical protein